MKYLPLIIAAMLWYMPHAYCDSALEEFKSLDNLNYLTAEDRQALADLKAAQSNQGAAKSGALKGQIGAGGEVVFTYGTGRPSIVCAVLELTDIALEPGESVSSVQIGDSTRWELDAAISGSPSGQIQHLIVKPLDSGLKTSLLITTDKRTYHLSLKSSLNEFMPQVRFAYPGQALEKLNFLKAKQEQERQRNTIAGTAVTVDELDFNYEITGDDDIKPVRVFNDGRKTYVQMPQKLKSNKLPALMVIGEDGGLFSKEKTALVNYRIQGDRYVVDSLFEKAKLIEGSGSNVKEVIIVRRG